MNMDGKTVLVTGSTDGVGRYVAAKLAAAGAKVLIHGRDKARAKTLADEIRGRGHTEPVFYQADLSSLAGARQLAEAVLAEHKRLDVFISNAGIGSRTSGPERQTSADGHELRFAVNYLSGFLLARLLLPLLKASAPSRIVNVASLGQHPIDFEDVMITKGYSGSRAYAQSKLAQIMFTTDLSHELEGSGVTVKERAVFQRHAAIASQCTGLRSCRPPTIARTQSGTHRPAGRLTKPMRVLLSCKTVQHTKIVPPR